MAVAGERGAEFFPFAAGTLPRIGIAFAGTYATGRASMAITGLAKSRRKNRSAPTISRRSRLSGPDLAGRRRWLSRNGPRLPVSRPQSRRWPSPGRDQLPAAKPLLDYPARRQKLPAQILHPISTSG